MEVVRTYSRGHVDRRRETDAAAKEQEGEAPSSKKPPRMHAFDRLRLIQCIVRIVRTCAMAIWEAGGGRTNACVSTSSALFDPSWSPRTLPCLLPYARQPTHSIHTQPATQREGRQGLLAGAAAPGCLGLAGLRAVETDRSLQQQMLIRRGGAAADALPPPPSPPLPSCLPLLPPSTTRAHRGRCSLPLPLTHWPRSSHHTTHTGACNPQH